MVVTASGKERRPVSVALREFESEHIAIKRKCPIKVRHLQMNMSDADPGVNWIWLLLLHRERKLNGFEVKRQSTRSPNPKNHCSEGRRL